MQLLSTIINSIMLSLADSKIPLNSSFASVCLLLSHNNEILPDPCKEEEDLDVESILCFNCRMLVFQQLCIMKKEKY